MRFPRLARALAADGKLDVDLAQAFQVTPWCIFAWKRKHAEFRAACEVTEEEKLEAVKRSLFHRATGYSHPATKIMATNAGVVEIPYVEHYPPDVAAIRYYLNNRAPERWRERSEGGSQLSELVVRVIGGLPNDESEKKSRTTTAETADRNVVL